jgi:hypothetical protein
MGHAEQSPFEQLALTRGPEFAIRTLKNLLIFANEKTDGPRGKGPYSETQIDQIADLMTIMLGLKDVPEIPGIGKLPLSEYVVRKSQELALGMELPPNARS